MESRVKSNFNKDNKRGDVRSIEPSCLSSFPAKPITNGMIPELLRWPKLPDNA